LHRWTSKFPLEIDASQFRKLLKHAWKSKENVKCTFLPWNFTIMYFLSMDVDKAIDGDVQDADNVTGFKY